MSSASVQEYDVVIVGAGPAGTTAAYVCRQHGLSVALIDKSTFPRDKLCGGLFTGRSRKHFQSAFGRLPSAEIFVEKDLADFWCNGKLIGSMQDFPALFLTMRWDLDNAMFRRAVEVGAIDFSGKRIKNIDISTNTLELENGMPVKWGILIGADGVNSFVARKIFGSAFEKGKIGFALEVEVPTQNLSSKDPVRIDFGAANWGYGWSFPKMKTTTIGVGGLHNLNPQMKKKMSEYMSSLGFSPDQKRFKGHFIPFGTFCKHPGKGSILLCGDAAGLVDSITGEGIAFAIKSGHLAGEVASSTIADGNTKKAAQIYKHSLREIHASLRIARAIRPLIFSKLTQPLFISAFKSSKTLKSEYMRLLAGEIEYGALGRTLLKRLPRFFLKIIFRN